MALRDVLARERLFTHPSLAGCLSSLPVRSPQTQMGLWNRQKTIFRRAAALVKSLGKPSFTPTQAKRLDSLGLVYTDLCKRH